MCIVNRDMWGFDLKFNNVWAYDKTDDILPAGSASLLLYHRRYTRQGFPLLILIVFFVESHVLSLLFPRSNNLSHCPQIKTPQVQSAPTRLNLFPPFSSFHP